MDDVQVYDKAKRHVLFSTGYYEKYA